MIGFFVWIIILGIIGTVGGLIADEITDRLEASYVHSQVSEERCAHHKTV